MQWNAPLPVVIGQVERIVKGRPGTSLHLITKNKNGGRGIRTPDELSPISALKADALNHSAIPPKLFTTLSALRAFQILRYVRKQDAIFTLNFLSILEHRDMWSRVRKSCWL